MDASDFKIEIDDDGTLLVLRLAGELDLGTMPQVSDALDRHCTGRRALVIDLRALEFMDSSGLRLMLQLQGREDGTRVAFIPPPDRVGRLLDMTGVRALLTWVDDEREALSG